jgi:hypothetical protein
MLLYKYRPWNNFTIEVIRDRKIFFPSKRQLNDPAELVHPVRFEKSYWDNAFDRARAQLTDQTFELVDKVTARFDFLDAIRNSHPEVEKSGEYGRYLHINDRHWRVVEAVCDQIDVHQSIAYYALNLMEDRAGMYDSEERLIQRLNSKLESVGILSLASRSDCPVMWAHYARNHEGVILVFDTDRDAVLKNAKPVEYTETRPKNSVDTVVPNLYKKGKSWEYEREYRVLLNFGDANYSFTPSALNGIILGAHMNEEDRTGALSLASRNPELTLFQACFSDSSYMVSHKTIC